MAKKNIFAQKHKIDQQTEAWFNRINDNSPFNAFSDEMEKKGTGEEMLDIIRHKIKTRKVYKLWRNVAAVAAILIVVGSFSYQAYVTTMPSTVKENWVSYVANKGEFKKILLPDSSILHLRPGAKIAVPHPFVQQTRRVKLTSGEVYFEVSHDPIHPFLVSTAQLTTEVLGTRFIINNDPLAVDIHVALLNGKVLVRKATTQLGILKPNQQLSFNKEKETTKIQNGTTYLAENWLNGEYILEDISLKSFANTFRNAFLLEIKFKQKELENLHVSIQFNLADNPKSILDQLKLIHGLKYQIKDKEVILMK